MAWTVTGDSREAVLARAREMIRAMVAAYGEQYRIGDLGAVLEASRIEFREAP